MMDGNYDMRLYEINCDPYLTGSICDNCYDTNKYISFIATGSLSDFTNAVNWCSQRFGAELASIHSEADMDMVKQLRTIGNS